MTTGMNVRFCGHDRWFYPHTLGRKHRGDIRVLCYQYGGESGSGLHAAGSPADWRCIALEKLSKVQLLENGTQHRTIPGRRPASRKK
jgi:hypothetical protein